MDRPLLVSGPLIQPIQADLKTETRRLAGLDVINSQPDDWEFDVMETKDTGECLVSFFLRNERVRHEVKSPYGGAGTNLWVRENWYVGKKFNNYKPSELPTHATVGFMADVSPVYGKPIWAGKTRPSIHLPRGLSRIDLTLKDIRVERLHDIAESGARREGVERGIFRLGPNTEKGEFQLETHSKGSPIGTYLDGFMFTWWQLNGRESWVLNPWVWVLSFNRNVS